MNRAVLAALIFAASTDAFAVTTEQWNACVMANIEALQRHKASAEQKAMYDEARAAGNAEFCQFAVSGDGVAVMIKSIGAIRERRSDFCYSDNMADTLKSSQDILRRFHNQASTACEQAGIAFPAKLTTRIRDALEP